MSQSRWLRLGEAAALAGVSRWTLWRWIVDGVVPPNAVLKVGKVQHRISRDWLEARS